jgi:hypothetical protein
MSIRGTRSARNLKSPIANSALRATGTVCVPSPAPETVAVQGVSRRMRSPNLRVTHERPAAESNWNSPGSLPLTRTDRKMRPSWSSNGTAPTGLGSSGAAVRAAAASRAASGTVTVVLLGSTDTPSV